MTVLDLYTIFCLAIKAGFTLWLVGGTISATLVLMHSISFRLRRVEWSDIGLPTGLMVFYYAVHLCPAFAAGALYADVDFDEYSGWRGSLTAGKMSPSRYLFNWLLLVLCWPVGLVLMSTALLCLGQMRARSATPLVFPG